MLSFINLILTSQYINYHRRILPPPAEKTFHQKPVWWYAFELSEHFWSTHLFIYFTAHEYLHVSYVNPWIIFLTWYCWKICMTAYKSRSWDHLFMFLSAKVFGEVFRPNMLVFQAATRAVSVKIADFYATMAPRFSNKIMG